MSMRSNLASISSPISGMRNDAETFWPFYDADTSSIVPFADPKQAASCVDMVAPSNVKPSEALLAAQRNLGLSKTELATICAVSRQTIYDWLNDRHEPDSENRKTLALLDTLAGREDVSQCPISSRLTNAQTAHGPSLVYLLSEPEPDVSAITAVIVELVAASKERASRSAQASHVRAGFAPLSEDERDANIAANLDDLPDRSWKKSRS
ncbi:MAG: helix-turn-helix domain-containing protein [Bradymonadaceae bacterium]